MNRVAICAIIASIFVFTGCPPKKQEPAPVQMDPVPSDTGGGEMLTDANNPNLDPAPISSGGGMSGGDESLRPSSGGRTYTVAKGDTLYSIARRMYGNQSRWKDIWNANKARIRDPNKLSVGTNLIIP